MARSSCPKKRREILAETLRKKKEPRASRVQRPRVQRARCPMRAFLIALLLFLGPLGLLGRPLDSDQAAATPVADVVVDETQTLETNSPQEHRKANALFCHVRPPDEEIVAAELSPQNYLNNFRIAGFHANRNADSLTHTMLLCSGANAQRYHATLDHTTLPRSDAMCQATDLAMLPKSRMARSPHDFDGSPPRPGDPPC